MTEFYDLNVKKTTVRVINAVAEKYQMNGEAEDVDALCIGSQREKEVSTFKETAQLEKMKKLSKKKEVEKNSIVVLEKWNMFVSEAARLNPNWLSRMPPKACKTATMKIVLNSAILQDLLIGMIGGENENYVFFRHVKMKNEKKERKNKTVTDADRSVLNQILDWIVKELLKSTTSYKKQPLEISSLSAKMKQFKFVIEANIQLTEAVDVLPTQELMRKLVPKHYSIIDFQSNLTEASQVDEELWFVRGNSKEVFFNLKNLNIS